MKNSKFFKRLSKLMATLMVLSIGFVYCSNFTAFAAVDLDVTIVPPEEEVANSNRFIVNLQINTKSTNGYVDLVINIEYDADIIALYAPVNQDGYRITGSKGQLTLTYIDPTGTNTPTEIGNEVIIPIEFIALESAPDTTTKIKATIDHAYNEKGKNITWTPIYDKEITIIRINEVVNNSSGTSSEETSSQFVVGKDGTLSRSSSIAGNGGKIASVVIGAIVVFIAGMVVGYIICLRKFEKGGMPSSSKEYDDYYDDDYINDSSIDASGQNNYASSLYNEDDSDDGYYRHADDDYAVADEDDYFASVPTGRAESSGNYLDAFNNPSISPRNIEPVEFGSMVTSSDVTGNDSDDDDYPILFMSRGNSSSSSHSSSNSAKPTFDEKVDTLFGKYSDNVERNVDDGYGGRFSSSASSNRRESRSDRSRRNR